ncbi:DUF3833 family protein [Leisingera daeponensis]|uniref:DUF3833 family protein n=1 Tax=Leisingera daeponensis TaxID=405746 RepID=UPI001C986534|nr:DUF3833 family protein [Leisingera daeponensis]MBY6058921.1 DUF3833 domain-containing protein [Leisingera daeponensis]
MKLLTICFAVLLLATFARSYLFSFRAQAPEDYSGTGPDFVLTKHLSGEILSEGVIFGPDGRMSNSFTARMVGDWNGDTGTLSEEFTYSNGTSQSRKWHLRLGPGNSFTATADDIVGEAQGTVSGSTVRLSYEIILPERSGGHRLTATDWLYLTEDGVIMNRAEMRKFGVKVAELVATMRPVQ